MLNQYKYKVQNTGGQILNTFNIYFQYKRKVFKKFTLWLNKFEHPLYGAICRLYSLGP